MATRKKTMIIAALAVLILVSVASAGVTDLVYATGRQQVSQLFAQSSEGQRILDAYNAISNPQGWAENYLTTSLCRKAGEICEKYNQINGIIGQIKSSSTYLENPGGFATQLMQQHFCTESPEVCNAYTTGMGYYGQMQGASQDAWGTAENFAMGQVMSRLSPDLGAKLSTIMMAKGYLDTLGMGEGSSYASEFGSAATESSEGTGEETGVESATGMAVSSAVYNEVSMDNRKKGYCIIGFNLDGSFGDIYNCMTQQQTDISKFLMQQMGTTVVGSNCYISKKGNEFFIKTKSSGSDSIDKPAECAVKIGTSVFKNLFAGAVKQGPEGKQLNSGTFMLDEKGMLKKAEFMVAKEETEYIMGGRKYKLPKGTTVIYEDGEVKTDFKYTEEPFEIFSFSNGNWLQDGTITPERTGSVNVQPAPKNADYRFRITGNFRMQTPSERLIVAKGEVFYTDDSRIRVGENSDVSFMSTDGGARVYTEGSEITITKCAGGEENAIDFCDGSIQASGSGFSFTEIRGLIAGNPEETASKYSVSKSYLCSFNSVECTDDESRQLMLPGESYYITEGSVSATTEDNLMTATISGRAGALLSGMAAEQGSLISSPSKTLKVLKLGAIAKLGKYITERGALNLKADIASLGIAPAVPDALKGAAIPSSERKAKFVYSDTGITAESKSGTSCIGASQPCTVSVRQPSSMPRVWVQWRGSEQDQLYINNQKIISSAITSDNETIIISLMGRNLLFVNAATGSMELQTKEWDLGKKEFRKASVGSMQKSDVEKLKTLASS